MLFHFPRFSIVADIGNLKNQRLELSIVNITLQCYHKSPASTVWTIFPHCVGDKQTKDIILILFKAQLLWIAFGDEILLSFKSPQ